MGDRDATLVTTATGDVHVVFAFTIEAVEEEVTFDVTFVGEAGQLTTDDYELSAYPVGLEDERGSAGAEINARSDIDGPLVSSRIPILEWEVDSDPEAASVSVDETKNVTSPAAEDPIVFKSKASAEATSSATEADGGLTINLSANASASTSVQVGTMEGPNHSWRWQALVTAVASASRRIRVIGLPAESTVTFRPPAGGHANLGPTTWSGEGGFADEDAWTANEDETEFTWSGTLEPGRAYTYSVRAAGRGLVGKEPFDPPSSGSDAGGDSATLTLTFRQSAPGTVGSTRRGSVEDSE